MMDPGGGKVIDLSPPPDSTQLVEEQLSSAPSFWLLNVYISSTRRDWTSKEDKNKREIVILLLYRTLCPEESRLTH